MSPKQALWELHTKGLVDSNQQAAIEFVENRKLFSVHTELRVVLYVGILLFTTGTGVLIYKNIDQISHTFLLLSLVTLCLGCFSFVVRHRAPFQTSQTKSRSPFGDYALLLGCLLFLTVEGYLHYQYNLFGTRYGLVTIIPAILFLGLAYFFDHQGVLAMGLTALISWVGVTVQPFAFYVEGNFRDMTVLLSAITLSLLLIGGALMLDRQRIKSHFTVTLLSIAGHLLLVALVAGLIYFESWVLPFSVSLALACFGFDRYARRKNSFLFLLMSTLYGYIGITYLVFHYLRPQDTVAYLYSIFTGIGISVYLLSSYREKVK